MSASASEGDNTICPVCTTLLPAMTWRDEECVRSICCGTLVCQPCNALKLKKPLCVSGAKSAGSTADAPGPSRVNLQAPQHAAQALFASFRCPNVSCRKDVPDTDEKRFRLAYNRAREHHDAWAHSSLGQYYEHGSGVATNMKLARKHYKKAAERGDARAYHALGDMYRLGEGGPKSISEATRCYRAGAEGGFVPSQHSLALMLSEVDRQSPEAFRLLLAASEEGFRSSQVNLAICYDFGRGVEMDLEKAIFWFKKAADDGEAIAMEGYATVLLEVARVKYGAWDVVGHSPLPEALLWLRKSVEAGNPTAQSAVDDLKSRISMLCASCDLATEEKRKKCMQCAAVYYCSTTCQSAHWKAGHKWDCCDEDGIKKARKKDARN